MFSDLTARDFRLRDDETEYLRDAGIRTASQLSFLIIPVTLFWWLLDPLVFEGRQEVMVHFAWLRAGTLFAQGAVYAGLRWLPLSPRVRSLWAVFWQCLNGAWIGWQLGALGGLETPWFHFSYLFAIFGVPVPMPLSQRVGLNVLGAAMLSLGYFLRAPDGLAGPYAATTLSYLTFATVLGILAGHYATRVLLDRHEKAHALTRLTSNLEQRVAEQTAELRALAEHLELAREAERAHIARELHDELGQELTALRFALSLARQRFARAPATIGQNLIDMEAIVMRTHDNIRHLVADLRPRALAELGLGPALEWLAERTRTQGGLEVKIVTDGDLASLPEARAAVAFRVAQESLTNVQRHAQANEVQVSVARVHDTLIVEVTDDGVGYDPGDRPSGHGIVGMRERVRAVGGTLIIERMNGLGTRVRAEFPAVSRS
ncbi:MAG: sensor histidine kinase [Myxococcales bacterium]|nr:sensor histidine kinase [Myxococcales bacterium]